MTTTPIAVSILYLKNTPALWAIVFPRTSCAEDPNTADITIQHLSRMDHHIAVQFGIMKMHQELEQDYSLERAEYLKGQDILKVELRVYSKQIDMNDCLIERSFTFLSVDS